MKESSADSTISGKLFLAQVYKVYTLDRCFWLSVSHPGLLFWVSRIPHHAVSSGTNQGFLAGAGFAKLSIPVSITNEAAAVDSDSNF